MSKVYLVPLVSEASEETVQAGIDALWQRCGLGRVFKRGDLAAVKMHVGEPGNHTHIDTGLVRKMVELIAKSGAHPYLTDTAVLYRSPRDNGVGHAKVAWDHGYGFDEVGAPFLPADGLRGEEEIEVRVDGTHFETVAIASGILQAGSVLVLSHATGHLGTGLGAALKNLGMGCASKKGKLRMHHGQQPRINAGSCTGCAMCVSWCPAGAISVGEVAAIDPDTCIGCGECIAVCLEGAVEFDWGVGGGELQERIVDHAAAVVRRQANNIAFVTVAQKITKDCDCLGIRQEPLIEDVGILASRDPVAIDQAVLDLFRERAGRTLESMSYPRLDGRIQIQAAERLGLGSSRYELETIAL